MADVRIAFADALVRKSPPWLRRTVGGKLMRALGLVFDDLIDRTAQSVIARYPGAYEDALPFIGRDRRIRRAPSESSTSYAGRLRRWRADHKRRGNPYALLGQLFIYFASDPRQIDLVYYSGTRRSMDEDGVITRDAIEWEADASGLWAQAWIFHYFASEPSLTDDEIEGYRLLPREWNAGHMLELHIIALWPDVELWDYPAPMGPWDEPGGVWTDDEPLVIGGPGVP